MKSIILINAFLNQFHKTNISYINKAGHNFHEAESIFIEKFSIVGNIELKEMNRNLGNIYKVVAVVSLEVSNQQSVKIAGGCDKRYPYRRKERLRQHPNYEN